MEQPELLMKFLTVLEAPLITMSTNHSECFAEGARNIRFIRSVHFTCVLLVSMKHEHVRKGTATSAFISGSFRCHAHLKHLFHFARQKRNNISAVKILHEMIGDGN